MLPAAPPRPPGEGRRGSGQANLPRRGMEGRRPRRARRDGHAGRHHPGDVHVARRRGAGHPPAERAGGVQEPPRYRLADATAGLHGAPFPQGIEGADTFLMTNYELRILDLKIQISNFKF